jgi:peptidyl-prolyl cis-trans isomerase A (cyclophilin A)
VKLINFFAEPNHHEGDSPMTLSLAPRRTVICASITILAIFAALSACRPDGSAGGGAASALVKPDKNAIATPAPDSFRVAVETSKGNFTIVAHRDWAPLGVDRFYHLVRLGYYDDTRFFRVLSGFMAQFGVNGDPRVNAAWESLTLPPDPVKQSNKRGMVTFAMGSQPDTRTTQLFINYADNSNLDAMGFAPIGQVVEGMTVVDSLYADYGEGAPQGGGPDQGRIATEGNAYLTQNFPRLDYIRRARIVP